MSTTTGNTDIMVTSAEQFVKDQALMHEMLEELQTVRRQRDEYRKKVEELQTKQWRDSVKFEIIKGHWYRMMQEHEGIWDNQQKFEPDGKFAMDYIESAKAAKQLGRKGDRIDEVQAWLNSPDSLPFTGDLTGPSGELWNTATTI